MTNRAGGGGHPGLPAKGLLCAGNVRDLMVCSAVSQERRPKAERGVGLARTIGLCKHHRDRHESLFLFLHGWSPRWSYNRLFLNLFINFSMGNENCNPNEAEHDPATCKKVIYSSQNSKVFSFRFSNHILSHYLLSDAIYI